MEGDTITVSFDDLDSDLQEKVIEHFKNDDYLLGDDWYMDTINFVVEKYDELEIDEKSIEFDVYRNDYNWRGEVDFDNKKIKDIIPSKFYEFLDEEFISSVTGEFKNEEMDRSHYVEESYIHDSIQEEFFPYGIEYEEGGKVSMPTNLNFKFIPSIQEKYADDERLSENLKILFKHAKVGFILFQDRFLIDDEIIDSIIGTKHLRITDEIEKVMDEVYDVIDEQILTAAFDEYSKGISSSYEYYTSDEYARDNLSGKTFEVEVDEDGNQVEVVDLNGDW